jgi:hypothetical protein
MRRWQAPQRAYDEARIFPEFFLGERTVRADLLKRLT